jgi:hypothetical protein
VEHILRHRKTPDSSVPVVDQPLRSKWVPSDLQNAAQSMHVHLLILVGSIAGKIPFESVDRLKARVLPRVFIIFIKSILNAAIGEFWIGQFHSKRKQRIEVLGPGDPNYYFLETKDEDWCLVLLRKRIPYGQITGSVEQSCTVRPMRCSFQSVQASKTTRTVIPLQIWRAMRSQVDMKITFHMQSQPARS